MGRSNTAQSAMTIEELQRQIARLEAMSAVTTRGGSKPESAPIAAPTVDGLVACIPFVGEVGGHGVTSNSIPFGQMQWVLDGECEDSSHRTYGRSFRHYLLGLCGDHGGKVMHGKCPAGACRYGAGRVFKTHDAENPSARGCTACAGAQRTKLEKLNR